MTIAIIESTDDVATVLRAAGTTWEYALTLPTGRTYLGNRPDDMVAAMIPGYAAIPADDRGDDKALEQRALSLETWAAVIQAVECSGARLEEMTEDEVNALMSGISTKPTITSWEQDVPLFMLATWFAPYTDTPVPSGRVVLLDPVSDVTYLQSIAALGGTELMTQQA